MAREQLLEKNEKRILFWCRDFGMGRTGAPGSPLANYFCVGAWFCGTVGGADGAGCDFVCFTLENTDVGPVRRAAKIDSVIDVSMKMIADQVVARERTDAAPRGPNAVWLP
jgi:hypothetical protein